MLLEHPAHAIIDGLELFQRLVQIRDKRRILVGHSDVFDQLGVRQLSAALPGLAGSRMINKQPAHATGGNRHEMSAIAKTSVSQPRELEVRLMDECRRGEGKVAPLIAPAVMGHLAKPLVDDRHELLERRGIAIVPAPQQICELE